MRRKAATASVAAALLGALAAAAALAGGSASPASIAAAGSTRAIVAPVAQIVSDVDFALFSAQRNLECMVKRKTLKERDACRDRAPARLDNAIASLRRLPRPLPSILDSPFTRAKVASLRTLTARARSQLTKTKGYPVAYAATKRASEDALLLLAYIHLTVVEIKATFEFPTTTYVAEVYHQPEKRDEIYAWTNSNSCGDFDPIAGEADWVHPDSELPGACPPEPVHAAVIRVAVRRKVGNLTFECTGVYESGSAPGVEENPAKRPCAVV